MFGAFNITEQCAHVIVGTAAQRAAHIYSYHAELRRTRNALRCAIATRM